MARTATSEWSSLLGRAEAQAPAAEFAQLVERQSRFVFRIAYAVLRNVEDAEDVAQDTFLKLFRNGAWKQIEDEKAFLARTAWRIAVDRAKSRRLASPSPMETPSEENSPETTAMVSEQSRTIHCLIDSLPEKLRRPLALSSIQEMTTRQIADLMDLPEGTVRRLITEARALVKQKISRMEGNPDV